MADQFLYTGNLEDWPRPEEERRHVSVPSFMAVGQYDEITPACAMRMKAGLSRTRSSGRAAAEGARARPARTLSDRQ